MKKFLLGLLIGLVVGATATWILHSTIESNIDAGKSAVGKSMKDAARSLDKAGDRVAD